MPISLDQFPSLSTLNYLQARPKIRSGDILLCSGSSLFSTLIQKATGSVWSHIAFIIYLEVIDRLMVLESVESIGVRTVPLSSYVKNYNASGKGYPGKLLIARHQQFEPARVKDLSEKAVDFFGYPYDTEEIVKIAARIGMKAFGFTKDSPFMQSTHSFICSEYAYECYRSVGITIDYDPEGFVSPADFAKTPLVEGLFFLNVN